MRNVLLIGGSGSGKSTLINMLGNFFLGGSLHNPPESMHVLIPTCHLKSTAGILHSEKDTADNTTSKTSAAHKYSWDSVSFIDTPGFADTSGPEQDDENVLKILEFAGSVEHLSAIVIVQNGTTSRVVSTVRTVISRLRGNIPDVALNNIIFVFTNSSDRESCNFVLAALPFDPCAVVFMNNSAFSTHPSTWSARAKQLLERDWEESRVVITKLLSHIDSMESFSAAPFHHMRACRMSMNDCLVRALTVLAELAKLEERCLDIEANLQRHRAAMERNISYTSTRTVQNTVKEADTWGEKCPACRGRQNVSGRCYGGGTCRGGGYAVVTNVRLVSETITDINEQMKSLYESARSDTATFESLLATVQAAKAGIKAELDGIAGAVKQNCSQILPICSQFSFKDECEALLQQLRDASVVETDNDRKRRLSSLVRSLDEIATRVAPSVKRSSGARPCIFIDAAMPPLTPPVATTTI